jgi:hypothetical protein
VAAWFKGRKQDDMTLASGSASRGEPGIKR